MSLPLVDVRFKLPVDLNAVLEAIADSEGVVPAVIARRFIESALTKKLEFPRLVHSKLDEIGMASLLGENSGVGGRK